MLRTAKFVFALAVFGASAHADVGYASRDYDFASRQMSDFTNRFERDLVNPVSRGVKTRPSGKAMQLVQPSSLLSVTSVPPSTAAPAVPNQMAAHYPVSERAQATKLFNDLLSGYGRIEQQFDIPRNDVAGSVAAFLAGSYMAYHNVDFPDENFKPLVEQMRQIIGSNPDFAQASNAAKQEMYEQMAILGMFMATTQMALKEKPNAQVAANMRQAAKGYLEQFLKTDADKVEITARGLVIR